MENTIFYFLDKLKKNNTRDWFNFNKDSYLLAKEQASIIFHQVYDELNLIENLEPLKEYRIYRDVRFSLDKTPYKSHFSASTGRKKPYNRGGFYIHLENNNCFVAGGFWEPNKEDLLKIRQSIYDSDELFKILNQPVFVEFFKNLSGDELKTAPKGFPKDHERIELLRKKQFLLIHYFTNKEVLSNSFPEQVANVFKHMLPFFNYMTEVLTTNKNGELIV